MALSNKEKKERLEWLVPILRGAGLEILQFYGDHTNIEFKNKNEPVTDADRASNEYIMTYLKKSFPKDGVLSEESKDDNSRFSRDLVWIIDPMDGTKEFISQNGEFSIMVGLTEKGKPILGAVYQPIEDRLYLGAKGLTATMDQAGATKELAVTKRDNPGSLRMVVSRSHLEPVVDDIRKAMGIKSLRKSGSVGLKCGLIARGECDVYIHPSPYTKMWDSCAPQAILEAAGGVMTDVRGARLDYRRKEVKNLDGMLASNGAAHERIVEIVRETMAKKSE